jgi:glycosyltransferase involved in cell wall biosynthesis
MHILLIHQAFVSIDEPGGTRHYEMAAHLVRQGHTVTVIASPVSYLTGTGDTNRSKHKEENNTAGLTIIRAYTYQQLHRSFVHRLLSFFSFAFFSFLIGLRIPKVDLVWGTSPPLFQAPAAWLISFLRRKPFLLEIRDLWPRFAVEVGVLTNPLFINLSEWLERFLYQRAKCVVVNSPGYIEHVQQRGAKQVELVPNGSDTSMFHPDNRAEELRAQYGWERKFLVLYAGAHGMSNDLGVVLQAADLLRTRMEIHFILVGDGKEKSNLQQQAKTMNLPNITFLPPAAKQEMHKYYSAADASLAILKPIEAYKTTYPNKVFDGMAAGRPLLLAIDGVSREVVDNFKAGLFVEPGDPQALARAVCYLLEHPDEAAQMGKNGRVAVEEHFGREKQARLMHSVIERLDN